MQSVKVKRLELLEVVKKNRDNHRSEFEKAIVVYRQRAIEELDKMIAAARNGDKIIRFVGLPEPEDHTDDYERVVRMLEMSVEENLEISARDFNCYVCDEWGWAESFTKNTKSYVS